MFQRMSYRIYMQGYWLQGGENTSWFQPFYRIESQAKSVLMMLTMNDPPRFDVRAVPILFGFVAALLGLARLRPFDRLPLPLVVLCLVGISGALVFRGVAILGATPFTWFRSPSRSRGAPWRCCSSAIGRPDLSHQRPNRQARRKSGRVDAGRLDHAGIHRVALDSEVRHLLAWTLQLGANAAAPGLQVGESDPR